MPIWLHHLKFVHTHRVAMYFIKMPLVDIKNSLAQSTYQVWLIIPPESNSMKTATHTFHAIELDTIFNSWLKPLTRRSHASSKIAITTMCWAFSYGCLKWIGANLKLVIWVLLFANTQMSHHDPYHFASKICAHWFHLTLFIYLFSAYKITCSVEE